MALVAVAASRVAGEDAKVDVRPKLLGAVLIAGVVGALADCIDRSHSYMAAVASAHAGKRSLVVSTRWLMADARKVEMFVKV